MHPYDIHIKFEYGYGYPYLRFKRIRIRIIRMFRHPDPSLEMAHTMVVHATHTMQQQTGGAKRFDLGEGHACIRMNIIE